MTSDPQSRHRGVQKAPARASRKGEASLRINTIARLSRDCGRRIKPVRTRGSSVTRSEGRARRPSVSDIKAEAVTILCSRNSARARLIVRGKSGHRRMPVVDDYSSSCSANLKRHLPQSRGTEQCSPTSYGRGGVAQHGGCQSCGKSGRPSYAASIKCRLQADAFDPAMHQPRILTGRYVRACMKPTWGRDIENQ